MKKFAFLFVLPVLAVCTMLLPLSARSQPQVTLVSTNSTDKNFNEAVTLFLSGEWDQAIVQFKNAKDTYSAQKNYRQVVASYLGLTNCYFFKGDYSKALEYCEQAIELHAREVKDDAEGLDTLTITQSLCKAALNHSQSGSQK